VSLLLLFTLYIYGKKHSIFPLITQILTIHYFSIWSEARALISAYVYGHHLVIFLLLSWFIFYIHTVPVFSNMFCLSTCQWSCSMICLRSCSLECDVYCPSSTCRWLCSASTYDHAGDVLYLSDVLHFSSIMF
jgi:hypothetical protein